MMNEQESGEETAAARGAFRADSAEALDSAAAANEAAPALRAELAAANDRALRAQAELDNYRKRSRKELEDQRRYAQLPLLGDLLPLLDNAHRAIQAAEKSPDASGFLTGFKMLAEQLEAVLARHHCTRIEALRQPFDPHLHAAIMQQPSSEHAANTVVQVAQEGYQLYDRVVRPAQVIVSTSAGDEGRHQPPG